MNNKYATEDEKNHITQMWGVNGNGHYTNLDSTYINYFKKTLPKFIGGSVLEIGPGKGNFALSLFNNYKITSYTIVDLKKNMCDAKSLFEKNAIVVNFIESKDYHTVFDKKFELFISNACLSEVPDYYFKNVVEKIFPHCKNLYIMDSDNDKEEYNNYLIRSVKNNFKNVTVEPCQRFSNMIIAGTNQ